MVAREDLRLDRGDDRLFAITFSVIEMMITKFYIIISRRNSGGRSQRISSAGGGSCLERVRFSWEAWNQTRVGIERNYVGIFIADHCCPQLLVDSNE